MQPLIWDRRPDGLRAPTLVCAFQGWNDAGDAASSAVSFLASSLSARRFARIDSEEFYDFQANRPSIRFGEDGRREISWPTVEIFEASAPRAPRDLVLVQGVEPSMRWRAFSAHIIDLAEALGVQVVVSLGALRSKRGRRGRRAIWCSSRGWSPRCAGGRSARTSSTSPRRWECRWSSPLGRCSGTCPTRARSP